MEKPLLAFSEISGRLHDLHLPRVDLVVGISRGGTTLACMVAHQLSCALEMVAINYRDDANTPRYEQPKLLTNNPKALTFEGPVLLVDDVSVTGSTLDFAKSQLASPNIHTLVCKGKGDFVLFPEVSTCVQWPWTVAQPLNIWNS